MRSSPPFSRAPQVIGRPAHPHTPNTHPKHTHSNTREFPNPATVDRRKIEATSIASSRVDRAAASVDRACAYVCTRGCVCVCGFVDFRVRVTVRAQTKHPPTTSRWIRHRSRNTYTDALSGCVCVCGWVCVLGQKLSISDGSCGGEFGGELAGFVGDLCCMYVMA